MPANLLRVMLVTCLLAAAAVLHAEDRTTVVEDPLKWLVNPFQAGGYSYPSGPNVIPEEEREAACQRIDAAFAMKGFKMKRNFPYDRDGVAAHLTGYDPERKVGYVWATPETMGEGFLGNPAKGPAEAQARLLSTAEVKLLEERAPQTREFIAVIIPFTHRLGYQTSSYEKSAIFEKDEAARLQRAYEAYSEKRLKALDTAVAEYVYWVADRRAEEYPAPSTKPRNLFPVARYSLSLNPHYPPGICGVGLFHPLPDAVVKKAMQQWGKAAGLDLSQPFTYQTKSASVTLTGYDAKQKIGYVWDTPSDNPVVRERLEALAGAAAADGLRIAWISHWDRRFNGDNPSYGASPKYAEILAALTKVAKITDPAERERAQRAPQEELTWLLAGPALERLQRRVKEFFEFAK